MKYMPKDEDNKKYLKSEIMLNFEDYDMHTMPQRAHQNEGK